MVYFIDNFGFLKVYRKERERHTEREKGTRFAPVQLGEKHFE